MQRRAEEIHVEVTYKLRVTAPFTQPFTTAVHSDSRLLPARCTFRSRTFSNRLILPFLLHIRLKREFHSIHGVLFEYLSTIPLLPCFVMLASKRNDTPGFLSYPLNIYFQLAKPLQSVVRPLQFQQHLQVRRHHRFCRRFDGPLCSVDQNDKDGSSGSGLGDSKSTMPDSPSRLVQSWMSNRSIAKTVDLSRRFISVLFLSNYCRRAAFAEKKLAKLAEEFCISRRLLILSAGLYSKPDDLIPWRVVSAARQREIDLSDERPCASFEITDRTYP